MASTEIQTLIAELCSVDNRIVNGTLNKECAHYYISHENHNHQITATGKYLRVHRINAINFIN